MAYESGVVPSGAVDEMGSEEFARWLYPAIGNEPFESWDAGDLLVLARMWQRGTIGRRWGPWRRGFR